MAKWNRRPKHADCARQRGRIVPEPGEPNEDGSRDRGRSELKDDCRLLGDRGDSLGFQLAQELDREERVTSGRFVARIRELRLGRLRKQTGRQLGERRLTQRPQANDGGDSVGRERVDRSCAGARFAGAGGRGDQDRELVKTGKHELQEAQRAQVGPVGVVEHEHHRSGLGHVRDQPMERVEVGEGRAGSRRDGPRSGDPEEGRCVGGRAAQEPGALGIIGAEQRLEELADDAEGKVSVELGGARRQRRQPAMPRPPSQLREQLGLADPGRALDQRESPVTGACVLDQALELAQLGLTLEQDPLARRPPLGHGQTLT
jgi:hypothetical protein